LIDAPAFENGSTNTKIAHLLTTVADVFEALDGAEVAAVAAAGAEEFAKAPL